MAGYPSGFPAFLLPRAAAAGPAAPAPADAAVVAEMAAELARLRLEVSQLRSENSSLAAARECPLCMERPRDAALPCGHAYCAACVGGLPAGAQAADSGGRGQRRAACCPDCRRPFSVVTRLFL